MRILQSTIVLLLLSISALNANPFLKFKEEVINPACIKLLQPWNSEKITSSVIIRSVVLDTCQESNIGFLHDKPTISNDGTVSYYSDPKDAHTYFAYRYLGKTSKGIHYIYHNGTIGAYTIKKEKMIPDLAEPTTKAVTVITKLGHTYAYCFKSATIENDTLVVQTYTFDANKPTASQCAKTFETVIVKPTSIE